MNAPEAVTLPPAVETTTSVTPAPCAGVVTVMDVEEFAVMTPAVPPKVTVVGLEKLVPVIVTEVPPATTPVPTEI